MGKAPFGFEFAESLSQILCRLFERQLGFQRSLVALVTDTFVATVIDLDIGLV